MGILLLITATASADIVRHANALRKAALRFILANTVRLLFS